MNKNVFNFAIVGCGKIGIRHAEKLNNIEGAKLIAVSDNDEERAKNLANKFSCDYYINYNEMIKREDVDVVNICVPSGLHAEFSINCAKAKKHILCEKPMALSSYDAELMIKEAARNDVKLFVVKQNKFNPPIKLLKQNIEKNNLGKIYLINSNVFWNRGDDYYKQDSWRGTKKLDGGALFTQASHFVDLILWLVNDDVKSVTSIELVYLQVIHLFDK